MSCKFSIPTRKSKSIILARYLALLRNIYNVSFKSPKVGRHFTFIGAKSTSKMANCVNWLTLWTNNRPTKWYHYQKQTKIEFDDQKFGCTSRKSHSLVVWLKVNCSVEKSVSLECCQRQVRIVRSLAESRPNATSECS